MKLFKHVVMISFLAVAMGCTSTGGGSNGGDGGFGGEGGSDPGLGNSGDMNASDDEMNGPLRTVYFAYDQAGLSGSAKDRLRANAQYLKDNGSASVEIGGNCDERGTEEYNLALGKRRAETARQYLVDLGIDGSRLSTISFGEEQPAVSGHNEAAWAKNRRADFTLR